MPFYSGLGNKSEILSQTTTTKWDGSARWVVIGGINLFGRIPKLSTPNIQSFGCVDRCQIQDSYFFHLIIQTALNSFSVVRLQYGNSS